MLEPSPHPLERQRIAALHGLGILDTPPEALFSEITELAKDLFEVPIALVSLVDVNRQWFKARVGLDAPETPRNISFCGHAILEDGLFVIEDTHADPRFADNPLVTGEPKIRFYAGAPLRSEQGLPYGTLCLIDRDPRPFAAPQRAALAKLARQVDANLHLRSKQLDLERAREAAVAMTRQRGALLASMTHEIRNPLSGIMGMTELLGSMPLEGDLQEMVDAIRSCGQTLVRVVDDILDLSNLDAQKIELDEAPFVLRDVVAEVQALLNPRAAHAGVTFEAEVADDVPTLCLGDGTRVRQIMSTLTGSLVQSLASGGVQLRVEKGPGDGVLLTFASTEQPLSEALRTEVYRPGSPVDDPNHGDARRLALAICTQLIELMNGQICEPSSHSLQVRLRLPSADLEPGHDTMSLRMYDEQARHVLVVDDNPVHARVLAGLLDRLGHRATAVHSGEEMLAHMAKAPCDLVFVKGWMPGTTGFDASIEARASGFETIPIVGVMSSVLGDDRMFCEAAGMTDLIATPVSLQAVTRVLERHLSGDQAAA